MTTVEQCYIDIKEKLIRLSEEEKTKLTAMILNDINLHKTNLEVFFFNELDNAVHNKLCKIAILQS